MILIIGFCNCTWIFRWFNLFRIGSFVWSYNNPTIYYVFNQVHQLVKAVMNNDNSLKSHNTLFRGILTHLNTDDKITHLLGEDIHYDDKIHPFVKGAVNHIKGISDLEFYVQGRKGINALVIFKGKKDDVSDFWISDEFTVKTEEQLIKY